MFGVNKSRLVKRFFTFLHISLTHRGTLLLFPLNSSSHFSVNLHRSSETNRHKYLNLVFIGEFLGRFVLQKLAVEKKEDQRVLML